MSAIIRDVVVANYHDDARCSPRRALESLVLACGHKVDVSEAWSRGDLVATPRQWLCPTCSPRRR